MREYPNMKLDEELAKVVPEPESVLTVGVFDGVHRGHHHLFSRMRRLAADGDRQSCVVTFRNHPASVLSPNFRPAYLTTLEDRLQLIENSGVDLVVPVTFDPELSRLGASEFAGLLSDRLKMRQLVIGRDFAMGHKREGDSERLTTIGQEQGFSVEVVEPLLEETGQVIRSTAVREALGQGDVAKVALLLGRNHTVSGTVVRGAGRGGPLGFPTANLELHPGIAMPGDGIYATRAVVDGTPLMAATSVGTRPTFGDGERTIEAFVLDYDGDLYGRRIALEFVHRLRDEVKFDTVAELQRQVDEDVDQARAVLMGAAKR